MNPAQKKSELVRAATTPKERRSWRSSDLNDSPPKKRHGRRGAYLNKPVPQTTDPQLRLERAWALRNTPDEDFDGFLTADDELVPIQDTGRTFSILVKAGENRDRITQFLWGLAEECLDSGYFKAAYDYLQKILALVDDPGEKAKCLIKMGVVMESLSDYQAALEAYSRAYELPPLSNEVWYFLNNNRRFCLNETGRYQEAEKYCRAAIEIEPRRHNAWKNLGIALQNQGWLAEAAKCFVQATKLCPADPRALAHLVDLVAAHKEILNEIPDLLGWLHECHEAVQAAKGGVSLQ